MNMLNQIGSHTKTRNIKTKKINKLFEWQCLTSFTMMLSSWSHMPYKYFDVDLISLLGSHLIIIGSCI